MRKLILFTLAILALNTIKARLIYVAHDANGSNNGTSWSDAYTNFQTALNSTNWSGNDTVWVKSGTYSPDRTQYGSAGQGNPREWKFFCPRPVWIFGGFAGTETNLNQRDWYNNSTILDGDIGIQGDKSDNVYQVVFLGNGNYMTFDGFTIKNGYANGGSQTHGAGLQVSSISSITLNNLIISDCEASGSGAGLHLSNLSSGNVSNIYLYNNKAGENGGGIYFASLNGVDLNHLYSYQNSAKIGGGIYAFSLSNLELVNVIACGNASTESGGGMYTGSFSNVTMVNISLTHNNAGTDGGAFYATNFSNCNFTNATIYNNTAVNNYGGLFVDQSSGTHIYNSIIWGNSDKNGKTHQFSQAYKGSNSTNMTVQHTIIEGTLGSGSTWNSSFFDMGNNLDSDPIILAGVGPDALACTLDDNYAPEAGSPAIDAGTTIAPGITSADPSGNLRIDGSSIDMGAFESQGTFPVEWLDFQGTYTTGTVNLSWETALEVNTHSFFIERKVDLAEDWEKVGEIKAQGNKIGVSTYGFTDFTLPKAYKLSYRLKQFDIDGKFDLSSTVEVYLPNSPVPAEIKVFPNPCTDLLTVKPNGMNPNNPVKLEIMNLQGKVVETYSISQANYSSIELDVASIPAGYYMLTLQQGYQKISTPFIKE